MDAADRSLSALPSPLTTGRLDAVVYPSGYFLGGPARGAYPIAITSINDGGSTPVRIPNLYSVSGPVISSSGRKR
jgi:hypothetical protein